MSVQAVKPEYSAVPDAIRTRSLKTKDLAASGVFVKTGGIARGKMS